MKLILIDIVLCILIVGIQAQGQSFHSIEHDFKGNIKSVIERSVGYPDSWREFDFDSLYRLKEKRFFRENTLLETEKWDYIENDSLLVIHTQIDDGRTVGRPVHTEYLVNKLYFDADKRLIRQESYSLEDTFHIDIFTNFIFCGNDILQYNSLHLYDRDTLSVELFEYEYSPNKLTVIIKKTDIDGDDSFTRTLKYNAKGNLISEIIDYNNPEVYLGGARTWSPERHDKYRIDYEYDDQGNWVEKYEVTWQEKYKIVERIIEYETKSVSFDIQ